MTPKRGRAVLWPSVIAADLLTGENETHYSCQANLDPGASAGADSDDNFEPGEKNTHHEALPVERGIKFSANLWIHLYDLTSSRRRVVLRLHADKPHLFPDGRYDFKTPSRGGLCPFLGQNTHGGT